MRLTVQHHNLRSTYELDSLLEERILDLQPRLQMDEARVRLERRWETSPAYRVAIYIVTPGPDLQAEGSDHTIRAAMGKALANLEGQIRHRERKPLRRVRSNLQTPPVRRRGRVLR